MIGTTAALISLAALQGGTSVAKGVIESRAAKGAAATQQAATQDALRMRQQMWGQQQQTMQPYVQAGQQSMGLLGSLMQPNGAPGAYVPPGMTRPVPPSMPTGPQQPLIPVNPYAAMGQGGPLNTAAFAQPPTMIGHPGYRRV